MEETKDLTRAYSIFRTVIYVSVLMEFFEYAIDPEMLDYWNGVLVEIHDRIKTWFIYHDGNLVYSKVATFVLVCITCIGTRNKKNLEFDARRMVLYPLVGGVGILVLSVWLFGSTMNTRIYSLRLNIILYMIASIIGTVLVHISLDNISKWLKEGLLKDRFNLENESFKQCEELINDKYSVNIPMRYYWKGKFRKGFLNITNPFRGRRRTFRVIFVRLTYWLRLNVNGLISVVWVKQRKITEKIRNGMTSGWLGTWVWNDRFCFPEFPKKPCTLNGFNSTILPQFGM